MKLGVTEMADMAEGVKALWSRPYFDKTRVGIYGTSYGGLAALLAMLNSCAPGVTVCNIDNGFGAGVFAARVARRVVAQVAQVAQVHR